MRILLVDDNPVANSAIAELLRVYGHEVATAGNGYGALTVLGVGPLPEIIILDLLMPGMGGVEFLERRQKAARLQAIPVLVLTAAADEDLAPLQRFPRTKLLRKPIDPAFLQAALKGVVS